MDKMEKDFSRTGAMTMVATDTVLDLPTNQKAERKLLATYVNVGTAETPVWEIMGAGIEESAIELGVDSSSLTDILGITETTINKVEMTQSLDPMELRGGQKLSLKLLDVRKRKAWGELSLFEILLVEGYLKKNDKIVAEVHKNCTISPQSIGGSSYVAMPIEISFSNDKIDGTIDAISASPTFTPDV